MAATARVAFTPRGPRGDAAARGARRAVANL